MTKMEMRGSAAVGQISPRKFNRVSCPGMLGIVPKDTGNYRRSEPRPGPPPASSRRMRNRITYLSFAPVIYERDREDEEACDYMETGRNNNAVDTSINNNANKSKKDDKQDDKKEKDGAKDPKPNPKDDKKEKDSAKARKSKSASKGDTTKDPKPGTTNDAKDKDDSTKDPKPTKDDEKGKDDSIKDRKSNVNNDEKDKDDSTNDRKSSVKIDEKDKDDSITKDQKSKSSIKEPAQNNSRKSETPRKSATISSDSKPAAACRVVPPQPKKKYKEFAVPAKPVEQTILPDSCTESLDPDLAFFAPKFTEYTYPLDLRLCSQRKKRFNCLTMCDESSDDVKTTSDSCDSRKPRVRRDSAVIAMLKRNPKCCCEPCAEECAPPNPCGTYFPDRPCIGCQSPPSGPCGAPVVDPYVEERKKICVRRDRLSIFKPEEPCSKTKQQNADIIRCRGCQQVLAAGK